MKVVGFIGSPRKNGNTAFLVNKILEGAKEKGASVSSYQLNDLSIKPCQSCYGCKQVNSKCVIDDDMQKLYDEIEHADALVIGSPLYMWQMTAQTKTFVDRLFALFTPEAQQGKNGSKTVILAYTCGNPESGIFQSYFDYTKNMFQFLGFNVVDTYIGKDTQAKELSSRPGEHDAMKKAGASLV